MNTAAEGWAYLQRLADRPAVSYEPMPEDAEWLVDPPDPAIWGGLPAFRVEIEREPEELPDDQIIPDEAEPLPDDPEVKTDPVPVEEEPQ